MINTYQNIKTDVTPKNAYEQFQLERYGNIIPDFGDTPDDELENGYEELERLANWLAENAELQLLNN